MVYPVNINNKHTEHTETNVKEIPRKSVYFCSVGRIANVNIISEYLFIFIDNPRVREEELNYVQGNKNRRETLKLLFLIHKSRKPKVVVRDVPDQNKFHSHYLSRKSSKFTFILNGLGS